MPIRQRFEPALPSGLKLPYKESDIIHEGKSFWVLRTALGKYEVLKYKATHSEPVGWFGGRPEEDEQTRKRAISHCEFRDAQT